MAAARRRLEERAAAVGALRAELEVRAATLEERRGYLRSRSVEVEERLSRNVAERHEAETRRVELDGRATAVGPAGGARRRAPRRSSRPSSPRSTSAGAASPRRPGPSPTASTCLRRQRSADERALEETREKARRAEVEETETRLRLEGAVEVCRRDLDCEPDGGRSPPTRRSCAEGVTPAARARELERELRLMGPINPLALQEYEELQDPPRVPRGPARRREVDPARPRQGHPGDRRGDRGGVRRRLRRRRRELLARCSRRCSPAAPAGCASRCPTTSSTPASSSRPSRRART